MTVSIKSRLALWTRACGRCQFAGCNIELLGDLISGAQSLNKAYVAHIVAETPGGPRGDAVMSPRLADDVENLMLLCDPHHRLIDGKQTWADYPVDRLQGMKARHEARMRAATAVDDDGASHVLFYGAKIGEHETPLQFGRATQAMQPRRWAAEPRAIHLEMAGAAAGDHEEAYWTTQSDNLRRLFDARVRPRIASGDIRHLSVFALGPQPLLIELGRLLGDITPASVHQLHREPPGWDWRDTRPMLTYRVNAPERDAPAVALKLSLSATLTDERIRAAIGDAAIWSLTVETPGNDILHRSDDLKNFRSTLRMTLDRIKARHGENAVINVFLALPVAAAVEVGRVWMPKADLPLRLFDQSRASGGFVARHVIGNADLHLTPALEKADA